VTEPEARELSPDGRWRWDGQAWRPTAAAAAASRPPGWLERTAAVVVHLRVAAPADWRALAAIVVVAAVADTALHGAGIGLAASLLPLAAAAGLVLARRVTTGPAIAVLALAALLGAGLTLRRSPWVVVPDALTAAALMLGVCGLTRCGGRLSDLPFGLAAAATCRALLQVGAAPLYVAAPLVSAGRWLRGSRRVQALAALRGLAIALPVVAVIGTLLAQADPVFASFFQVRGDPADIAGHAGWLLAGAWAMAGLCRAASAEPMASLPALTWRLGRIEGLVVLGALDVVFAAFTVAQVVAASGAGSAAIRARGLTYAEYAHSGFFQLLWVAGITLVLLLVLRAVVDQGERAGQLAFLLFAEVAIALTMVIVVVAFQRLALYESVYGFTMLRLYCQVFAGWIAVIYAALALALTPAGRRRHWFLTTVVLSGVAGLLALNAVNPEALVVRLDVAEAQTTHRLDLDYLTALSDDAVPALVATRPALSGPQAHTIRGRLCSGREPGSGWANLNLAALAAQSARRSACRARGGA
jgi:hypothetical protein